MFFVACWVYISMAKGNLISSDLPPIRISIKPGEGGGGGGREEGGFAWLSLSWPPLSTNVCKQILAWIFANNPLDPLSRSTRLP